MRDRPYQCANPGGLLRVGDRSRTRRGHPSEV
jgi:hypothetical protein